MTPGASRHPSEEVLVSVVMPCLNEARTVRECVLAARDAITAMGVNGEIVVADNGSTDGSQNIALDAGARVIDVPLRGYGSAIRSGCSAASGRYLIIGDADASYDFGEIAPFVDKLRLGADIVIGSRFKGEIIRGAMPWKNRYIGNPLLTRTLQLLFGTPRVSDAHCGLRALTRDAFEAMGLRTSGMEFASEMIVRAAKLHLSLDEVPITLRPDGRDRAPHLRPWRDGWRHLKFMLMFAPGALFLLPGLTLLFLGLTLIGSQLIAPAEGPLQIGQIRLDFHWAIFGGLLCVVGYQITNAYFQARIYSVTHDLRTDDQFLIKAFRHASLERALVAGLVVTLFGVGLLVYVFAVWVSAEYGPLDLRMTRVVIFASTLTALGVQTVSNAFIFSIMGDEFRRRLVSAEADHATSISTDGSPPTPRSGF